MHDRNFLSREREKIESREGKQREDERKYFFHPLACDEVRERGRDCSSLSPSFILSSYARDELDLGVFLVIVLNKFHATIFIILHFV